MSDVSEPLLIIVFYRIFTITVGLAFAYLGYKLFCQGMYDKAGELDAVWGDFRPAMKRAAPGTFFALFGTVIVAISLWRGVDITKLDATNAPPHQRLISGKSQPLIGKTEVAEPQEEVIEVDVTRIHGNTQYPIKLPDDNPPDSPAEGEDFGF